ncbi:Rieske 2Fe-2S domain-containing protein [Dermatophilus congolensis]|uniref:Rieske 2Fe-2S domain-containing protein n=1 Tax=Dermatophilus congolensis TaxID=1863 RepID=UPI001AAE25D4|nr:Rieske (2Fe-2S) protein [Dermatophilus congolensis]MBO3131863.1 Rieske (2Fe-2S) protein [Dermatophilus congolensis]MBO3133980.1 Rieske (2Fe-2S) protein [Dermatophilus congolensis]MBO3136211.1 Rieske (2Fe-2S) protein [Dermatophilus congolensis]MBO3138457.1 Rieske (2Fe-2S) protein [Dermatophilus congolensis]
MTLEQRQSAENRDMDRRTVLRGITGLGVSAATITILAACGASQPAAPKVDQAAVIAAVKKAVSEGKAPVGGAAFIEDPALVVTQPKKGSYMVFSSVCTHDGGIIDQMSDDGKLVCPKHGAQYDPATGQPVAGPAPAALQKFDVPVA